MAVPLGASVSRLLLSALASGRAPGAASGCAQAAVGPCAPRARVGAALPAAAVRSPPAPGGSDLRADGQGAE